MCVAFTLKLVSIKSNNIMGRTLFKSSKYKTQKTKKMLPQSHN